MHTEQPPPPTTTITTTTFFYPLQFLLPTFFLSDNAGNCEGNLRSSLLLYRLKPINHKFIMQTNYAHCLIVLIIHSVQHGAAMRPFQENRFAQAEKFSQSSRLRSMYCSRAFFLIDPVCQVNLSMQESIGSIMASQVAGKSLAWDLC